MITKQEFLRWCERTVGPRRITAHPPGGQYKSWEVRANAPAPIGCPLGFEGCPKRYGPGFTYFLDLGRPRSEQAAGAIAVKYRGWLAEFEAKEAADTAGLAASHNTGARHEPTMHPMRRHWIPER